MEVDRLKALKRQEIEMKLQSIKRRSEAAKMPFTEAEMDEDFDPEEHDRKMKVAKDYRYTANIF